MHDQFQQINHENLIDKALFDLEKYIKNDCSENILKDDEIDAIFDK